MRRALVVLAAVVVVLVLVLQLEHAQISTVEHRDRADRPPPTGDASSSC
jgi:hypothetical protein